MRHDTGGMYTLEGEYLSWAYRAGIVSGRGLSCDTSHSGTCWGYRVGLSCAALMMPQGDTIPAGAYASQLLSRQ